MNAILPFERPTIAEKFKLMESLWQGLSRNYDQFESPAWHGEEEQEIYMDWKVTKAELRKRKR